MIGVMGTHWGLLQSLRFGTMYPNRPPHDGVSDSDRRPTYQYVLGATTLIFLETCVIFMFTVFG